jgi:hypothetical protein
MVTLEVPILTRTKECTLMDLEILKSIAYKRTVKEKQQNHNLAKLTGSTKKLRTLKDKEKVLYAPFSNIGALNFEKSTGYITIPDNQVVYTRTDGENTVIDESKANEG